MNWQWYLLGWITWPAMFVVAIFADNIGINFPSITRNEKVSVCNFFVGQLVIYHNEETSQRCNNAGYKVRSLFGMKLSIKILVWRV